MSSFVEVAPQVAVRAEWLGARILDMPVDWTDQPAEGAPPRMKLEYSISPPKMNSAFSGTFSARAAIWISISFAVISTAVTVPIGVAAIAPVRAGGVAGAGVPALVVQQLQPRVGAQFLGDVVISVPYATRQARRRGDSPAREMDRLLVHGYLHLLGYDHETDDGEMLALHHFLHRQCSDDVQRYAGIVAFAMSRRAFDQVAVHRLDRIDY